jgi:hypothetical protein
MNINTTKQTVGIISLDEAQIQGAAAAQEFHNSLPAETRYSEENIEKATKIAEQEKKAYRANSNGTVAIPQMAGPSTKETKEEYLQRLIRNKYLRALSRVAANKIDEPNFEAMDYLEILAVLSFKESGKVPTIEEWIQQMEVMTAPPKEEEKKE